MTNNVKLVTGLSCTTSPSAAILTDSTELSMARYNLGCGQGLLVVAVPTMHPSAVRLVGGVGRRCCWCR